MNKTRIPLALLTLLSTAMLVGCSSDTDTDLRKWMDEQGANSRGKIDNPPQLKPYEPFAYNAFDLPDPFKPRKIEVPRGENKLSPDLTRRKEALEAFPLENLRMVGTLEQDKQIYALVRTNDNRVYQVKKGNYMGLNYGMVTSINEVELVLKELTQDGAGDWTERPNKLSLVEASSPDKGQKK
jgi:type IV pilus assembly protein PilP